VRLIEYCARCGYENRAATEKRVGRKCPDCGTELEYEEVYQSDIDRAEYPHREHEK